MASGGPTRFTDSAWEQVIPWSEKPICPLKKLNTSANPPGCSRIGVRAKMPFPIHPHMLRHGCGYALANAGHDTRALQAWLGHKNIQHTVRYTELAPDRFKNFWR
jgi:integrase